MKQKRSCCFNVGRAQYGLVIEWFVQDAFWQATTTTAAAAATTTTITTTSSTTSSTTTTATIWDLVFSLYHVG